MRNYLHAVRLSKPPFFNLINIMVLGALSISCSSIDNNKTPNNAAITQSTNNIYGTTNDYAKEAIYFLMTDRFVDGDPSNNHENQGGEYPTFDRPLVGENGETANVGYLGGDFQGVINNAQYIKDMGFTSVWLTPIYDNPDEAFSGGLPITYGGKFKDGGKTGYHGYWGVNFFKTDEHLTSPTLGFSEFTQRLNKDFQLDFVLDIVANHGSPSYTMPVNQKSFGKLYDENNTLVADHQNLAPKDLNEKEPLHQFFNNKPDIGELSDFNENNPEVLAYFTKAYLYWLNQGADSIRIDTIKHMPHHFWKKLTDNLRAQHPDLFIFAESFSYDATFIAEHTKPENGGVSVLDFPGQKAITGVFENPNSSYADLLSYLHLTDGLYQNPYELMTFYDNHDMPRMNANDNGFIDANNWLFTSRGIPVIYYGSEINFMTGKAEHEGNRNYLGQANIERAKKHIIHQELTQIAQIRKHNIALQKGVQLNVEFKQNTAVFYRVYQKDGINQTALVLLNKSDSPETITVNKLLNAGVWQDAQSKELLTITPEQKQLSVQVNAHDVKVLLLNSPINNAKLLAMLK
ncbi:alpha-amylase family glycosyl hydrolase [Pseudocolwellia agarivorans]|uniref:alpha-amylase family glycosyl hydrolase n=1 Tax=Pseudocolwellia agarivorans TaxID=1911682 RepID=UPI0009869D3F|nr:alpha-amylase family glycosyl hydrolase [Pseudocolwellia agarivorans]